MAVSLCRNSDVTQSFPSSELFEVPSAFRPVVVVINRFAAVAHIRSCIRLTCTAVQFPCPRAVGMPATFRPLAIALSD